MPEKILIATIENDLHARAVFKELTDQGASATIIDINRMATNWFATWRDDSSFIIKNRKTNTTVYLDEVGLIWWRRASAKQVLEMDHLTNSQISLIQNDSLAAIQGGLLTAFNGVWVSHPYATIQAGNKLKQLKVAKGIGFNVPATIVSNSSADVNDFYEKHGAIIVKPVVGATDEMLLTQEVKKEFFDYPLNFELCPQIYQEYIKGRRHIRLNCFGDRIYAYIFETDDLDWRPNLNIPINRWSVPDEFSKKVIQALNALNLKMGVFDFKITDKGDIYWIEINPQGQFLFLEGITSDPLTQAFAEFLIHQSKT